MACYLFLLEKTLWRGTRLSLTHTILTGFLMPQRWCCGGTDRLEEINALLNSTVVFTWARRSGLILWLGVGISLEVTEYSQTIFLHRKLSGLWREKGGLYSLSGARTWGTRTMRHGGVWRFQLEVMEMFLPALATTSQLCDTFWELGAVQNWRWELHFQHSTSVLPKPSLKCC